LFFQDGESPDPAGAKGAGCRQARLRVHGEQGYEYITDSFGKERNTTIINN